MTPRRSLEYDLNYFTSSATDQPPLHALKSVTGNPNGVYVYSSGSFPTIGAWTPTTGWT